MVPTDLFSMEDTPQHRIVEATLLDLEKFLDVSAQRVDISKVWDKSPPKEANGQAP